MDEESAKRGLNVALLATPAEGLSGRFVKLDKARFGTIPCVTDRDYYTNSFHVPVYFPCLLYTSRRNCLVVSSSFMMHVTSSLQ